MILLSHIKKINVIFTATIIIVFCSCSSLKEAAINLDGVIPNGTNNDWLQAYPDLKLTIVEEEQANVEVMYGEKRLRVDGVQDQDVRVKFAGYVVKYLEDPEKKDRDKAEREAKGKGSIYFHKIRYTDSYVQLVEWNTKDTLNSSFVKEIVDNNGNTKELRFYNYQHQLYWADSGLYGGAIVKYDYYDDSKIVETFFSSSNEIANDFSTSDMPYRFIYYLSDYDYNEIERTEMKYKIDFEWTKESLDETIEQLEYYRQHNSEDTELTQVFGYSYAFAKMHGINPEKK